MAKDDLVMFSHEFDGVEHLIAKDQFGVERDFIRPNNIMVISENNTYPVKDCKEVDVQLPEQKAVKLQIAENGEFTPDTYSGEYYDEVTVQMATELTDEEITITENGTYKPSTGKMFSKVTVDVPCDTMVGYDEWGNPVTPYVDPTTGKLEIDKLPDHIKVTVLPTKTDYIFGEKIDYSGIEVRAYNKDGSIWDKMGYTNGIIPFNELMFLTDKLGVVMDNGNEPLLTKIKESGMYYKISEKGQPFFTIDDYEEKEDSVTLSFTADVAIDFITACKFKTGYSNFYRWYDIGLGNGGFIYKYEITLNKNTTRNRISPFINLAMKTVNNYMYFCFVWEISDAGSSHQTSEYNNRLITIKGDENNAIYIKDDLGTYMAGGNPSIAYYYEEADRIVHALAISPVSATNEYYYEDDNDLSVVAYNFIPGRGPYGPMTYLNKSNRCFLIKGDTFHLGSRGNTLFSGYRDYMPTLVEHSGNANYTLDYGLFNYDVTCSNDNVFDDGFVDGRHNPHINTFYEAVIKYVYDLLPDPNNDSETDNQLMYDVVIPFNCPPIYQAQSDLDCGITQPILFSQWGIAQTGIVGSIIYEYDIEGASVTFAYTPDSGGFYFVVASQDRNTKAAITVKKYNVATNELISAETNTININTSYSYDDKTVYFYRGTVTTKGSLEVAVPVATTSQAGIFRNHEGQIAWTMIYGENITDTTKVSQPVRVQWKRPGDKKTLETTMELNVLIPKAKRT